MGPPGLEALVGAVVREADGDLLCFIALLFYMIAYYLFCFIRCTVLLLYSYLFVIYLIVHKQMAISFVCRRRENIVGVNMALA